MVDRILHIGHRFSNQYDKTLLEQAAEVYLTNGNAAVAPYLVNTQTMTAAEAETLAQAINREMLKVNREVLLYYSVLLLIFLTFAGFGFASQSYIFGAVFSLPALRILYSILKFLRRNKLR